MCFVCFDFKTCNDWMCTLWASLGQDDTYGLASEIIELRYLLEDSCYHSYHHKSASIFHKTHNLLINTQAEPRMEDITIQNSLYVERKWDKNIRFIAANLLHIIIAHLRSSTSWHRSNASCIPQLSLENLSPCDILK